MCSWFTITSVDVYMNVDAALLMLSGFDGTKAWWLSSYREGPYVRWDPNLHPGQPRKHRCIYEPTPPFLTSLPRVSHARIRPAVTL